MSELFPEFEGIRLPLASDPRVAATGQERWLDALAGDKGALAEARGLVSLDQGQHLTEAIFGNSSFLTLCVEQEPTFFLQLLTSGVTAAWDHVLADVAETTKQGRGQSQVAFDPSASLRIAKRRAALTVAVADICDLWGVEKIIESWTHFADATLRCAVSHLIAEASRKGRLPLSDPDDPEKGSGYIILALGKYGAGELNYSSDIDLVVFFDPERVPDADIDTLPTTFINVTRQLVRLISHRTQFGYVFRCDLRLRPDPNSTPVAMSVHAAESYYESAGQNWERAAFIKARPVAGDLEAGWDFLSRLRPFVWRRYLDFASIQDIHSMKRQIDSHRGNRSIAAEGHNVKLGRGGIREIEFFAQTQQLVWGGRLAEMRQPRTLGALEALCKANKISASIRDELGESYLFLRRVEHRLQMIADEQTHTLPSDPIRFAAVATFLGYRDPDAFRVDLLFHFQRVAEHYRELFSGSPSLAVADSVGGNLVFTGSDPDPETLETLARLGFENPTAVDETIRRWHRGRIRATHSARAREMLTELLPLLLKELSRTPDPKATFLAFDVFLTELPAGVQVFSMICAHPQLLQLIVDILGTAPRIAEQLARRPVLLEGVLTGDFFAPLPPSDVLEQELMGLLDQTGSPEDELDAVRRWANERLFQIGILSLKAMISVEEAGHAWSDLAETCIRVLLPRIEAEFQAVHGAVPGCDMAVIALGKLGSREMTATSDLDLIFIYTTPSEGAMSEGNRPLMASQYFARLSQKFINALTAPMASGRLFEVDMRLRPSGRAGPIAISFEAFDRYQREQAWTWEHMALTRARVITASSALRSEIERTIHDVLTTRRDPETLRRDVAEMRARIEKEHPTQSIWATKRVRGGLVDIEFIVQYLQLRFGHENQEILSQTTRISLERCAENGFLTPDQATILLDALLLLQSLQSRLRLTIEGEISALGAEDAPESLVRAVDGVFDLEFSVVADKITNVTGRSYGVFQDLIEH